jgi:MFS family permease
LGGAVFFKKIMTSNREITKPSKDRISALAVVCAVGYFGFAGHSLLFPVIPHFAVNLGASVSGVGLIVAAYSYAITLTVIPIGYLGDKFPKRHIWAIGLLILIFMSLSLALGQTSIQLTFIRIVQGIGAAALMPTGLAAVTDLASPGHRGKALGWYTTSTQSGFMSGPIIGGFILNHYGFNAAFYASSAMGILGLIILLFGWTLLRRQSPSDVPGKAVSINLTGSAFRVLIRKSIIAPLLTFFAIAIGLGTIVAYIPLYCRTLGIT